MQRRRMDSMISSFLREEDPQEQERILAEIVSVEALPIIRRVIRQQLGLYLRNSSKGFEDSLASDLYHDIATRIIERLRKLRSNELGQDEFDFDDFSSYVSRISKNVCHDFLREKYPTRHNLKNRIRYLLTTRPEFSLWKSNGFNHCCGLSEWEDSSFKPNIELDDHLLERVRERTGWNTKDSTDQLTGLLQAIFTECAGPIEVDRLVSFVIKIIGSSEPVTESLDSSLLEIQTELVDQRPRADQTLEDRERLRSLWNDILKLTAAQRKLILFSNLDVIESDLWSLFIESGTVEPNNILEALDISQSDFMSLWPRIPLNLIELADHLGLTRAQVVKARFNARARLRKHLQYRTTS